MFLVFVLAGCQIPPVEVLRGIQRETLVGYFAKDHLAPVYERGQGPGEARGHVPAVRSGLEPVVSRDPARPQCILSPFTAVPRLVDVSALAPGDLAVCPHTGRQFIVPPMLPSSTFSGAPVRIPESLREPTRSQPRRVETSGRQVSPPKLVEAPQSPDASRMDRVEPIEAPVHAGEQVPTGFLVPEKPGYVYSPFTDRSKLVDVAGLAPGTTVRCPYSGKLFRVPLREAEGGTASPAPPRSGGGAPMLAAPKPKPKPETAPEAGTGTAVEPGSEEPSAPPFGPEPDPGGGKKDKPSETGAGGGDAGTSVVPVAKRSDGKPGYVVSPYGNYLVDVRGKAEGSIARCPFTGKLFKVPAE